MPHSWVCVCTSSKTRTSWSRSESISLGIKLMNRVYGGKSGSRISKRFEQLNVFGRSYIIDRPITSQQHTHVPTSQPLWHGNKWIFYQQLQHRSQILNLIMLVTPMTDGCVDFTTPPQSKVRSMFESWLTEWFCRTISLSLLSFSSILCISMVAWDIKELYHVHSGCIALPSGSVQ